MKNSLIESSQMAEELYRFDDFLTLVQLESTLDKTSTAPVQKAGETANLDPIEKSLKRLKSKNGLKKTDYDLEMCEVLHKQLKHLSPGLRVDMRFWQWLTITRLPEFVWLRWHGEVPQDIKAALGRSGMCDRFLGKRTLRGRNRNALARLFFTAEILHDKALGYKLVTSAFVNQDRHTSIFEREMGLLPEVAKALIKITRGLGSEEIQKMAKRLNHIGSSLVLEIISESELLSLLK
jgi:hypothetical protein